MKRSAGLRHGMQHSPGASLTHDGGRRRNGRCWQSCVPSSWHLEGLQGLPQQYEGWECGRSARTARLRAVLIGGSHPRSVAVGTASCDVMPTAAPIPGPRERVSVWHEAASTRRCASIAGQTTT